jgi:hypothetical protein
MNLSSHLQSFAARRGFFLFILAQVFAVSVFSAHAERQSALLKTPLSSQIAITGLSTQKTEASYVTPRVPDHLLVTVINMSGKSRQAALGGSKVDLPEAQRVVLQVCAGDMLRVVSDTNTKVEERFVISKQDAGRILIVK